MTIDAFIDNLAATAVPVHVTNPYRFLEDNAANQVRRRNIRAYLQKMADIRPQVMLVGEAPGYRGARLTGIPFTSPHTLSLLSDQLGALPLARPEEWLHIQKEASATMMWETLAQITAVPLLWNAFPFHPHQPDRCQSNRKPTGPELALGRPFLSDLCALFNLCALIAVGSTAAHALSQWGIPHQTVRHPSHGGKQPFQHALFNLLNTQPATSVNN